MRSTQRILQDHSSIRKLRVLMTECDLNAKVGFKNTYCRTASIGEVIDLIRRTEKNEGRRDLNPQFSTTHRRVLYAGNHLRTVQKSSGNEYRNAQNKLPNRISNRPTDSIPCYAMRPTFLNGPYGV
jgi:hypothetical protein